MSLNRLVNAVEDVRDLRAKQQQDRDDHHGNKKDDKGVFDEPLSRLVAQKPSHVQTSGPTVPPPCGSERLGSPGVDAWRAPM
jgi:hypothetical protein